MKTLTRLTTAVLMLTTTMCATGEKILIEVRAPKSVEFSHASFFFVGERSSEGNALASLPRTEDGTNNIFHQTIVPSAIYNEHRFGIVIVPQGGRHGIAQVFELPIKGTLKTANWSAWKRPKYTENAQHVVSNFMDDTPSPDRSTITPTNCFEVRFKKQQ